MKTAIYITFGLSFVLLVQGLTWRYVLPYFITEDTTAGAAPALFLFVIFILICSLYVYGWLAKSVKMFINWLNS